MAIDPTRAVFVQNEYRYETAQNLAIRSTYPNAREIVLETNLRTADAQALANDYFNALDSVGQTFDVEYEGSFMLEELAGSPPQFICDFPEYQTDGRTSRMLTVEVDYMANRSNIVVRG